VNGIAAAIGIVSVLKFASTAMKGIAAVIGIAAVLKFASAAVEGIAAAVIGIAAILEIGIHFERESDERKVRLKFPLTHIFLNFPSQHTVAPAAAAVISLSPANCHI
jgi:uncharacterized membrane protein YuzA (DUF378 family)